MKVYLREDLAAAWSGRDIFATVNAIEGDVFRHKEGRKTLRFELAGKHYFLKLHKGIGWKEILKNLAQFRLPVIGAANEWRAIQACGEHGIDTLTIAGYGKRGLNPARQRSFLITDALEGVQSAEDICLGNAGAKPDYAARKKLVERVAAVSRRFHGAGINHRDFYLCHFLLGGDPERNPRAIFTGPLYVIDLHRAQVRRRVPRRWLVKDLGALYFSVCNLGFSRRDIVRFLRGYVEGSVASNLRKNSRFWRAVRRRAIATYKRDFGVEPQLPL